MSFRAPHPASIALVLVLIGMPARGESQTTPAPALAPAARVAGANPNWLLTVSTQIEREEYHASVAPSGLQAPNRANNLRTYFHPRGIEVVPRDPNAASPSWRFAWSLSRWGRQGRMRAVAPAGSMPRASGSRVVYAHAGFEEWYENGRRGLEQGFEIEAPPPGNGELRVESAIAGGLHAELRDDGAIDLFDDHGACALRYSELRVSDAAGRALAARFVVEAQELAIVVDDRGARYPIMIDPLLTAPTWTAEVNQAYASFGNSVSTAGDVNGDGFSDVIIGAPYYDDGDADEGRAFVYLGSSAGLAASWAWTVAGEQAGALFGWSVAAAGDVNGDGYSDVIVGAYNYDNGQTDEGRAFVFHGSASGLATTPIWTAESDQADARLGYSVATAGDVNADGYADVIVSAYKYDNGQNDEGRAFVYHGSAAGLASSAAWTAESNQIQASFGFSVATAGDVNADGYADVIVGAPDYDNGQIGEGRVLVYHGSTGGLSPTANWAAESDEAGALLGYSVATAGDVNGDGFSDVVTGAPNYDLIAGGLLDEGRVFVYQGSAAGLGASAAWFAESGQAGALFGYSAATAGDVNGDGFADVIVGAPLFDNDQMDEGRAFGYFGSAIGLSLAPGWAAERDQASAYFGSSVATAGDVNGDGYSDVIAGVPNFNSGDVDEGGVFVYHGLATGLAAAPAWTTESDQAGARYGAWVSTAGDVNGDGFSDVIIGAQKFDNGQTDEGRVFVYHGSATGLSLTPDWTAESDQDSANFGCAVATAGDVNGDGFSDVIVGAQTLDHGERDEGRAFVYHGSATGLSLAPNWTAEGDQAGGLFGSAVATAGDVNGDGFGDVIVGAYAYDNGEIDEGRAFVYHGSAAGLSPTPNWSAEGGVVEALFGNSVATAGDVNGDGFSDVIVGAPLYSLASQPDGRVFVYNGSVTGLSPSYSSTLVGGLNAAMGTSVATAGDVNGDGFSDVIVGSPFYSNGESSEGRALVFRGSAAGLETIAAWTAESDQMNAQFGWSVATAGDVNGDGFSDVIVAAPQFSNGQTFEGREYVYHGSATGPSLIADWTAESNQPGAGRYTQVATAGDVNGDGFSDVIVGAQEFDNGESNEGRAFVYYGNGGDGLDLVPRQVRADDSGPIASLGQSNAPNAFRLKALGRTPAGRGNVRLQREIKPFSTPFNGGGLATGSRVDTGTPTLAGSAIQLSELTTGLTAGTEYHWRERIVSDSPYFPHSRWLSPAGKAPTEAAVRTRPATVGVVEPSVGTTHLWLETSAPNPFTSRTQLAYVLPARGHVRLAIFDVAGHEVAELAAGVQEAGRHALAWDGGGAGGKARTAGVYFVRLEFAGRVESRKLVLAK